MQEKTLRTIALEWLFDKCGACFLEKNALKKMFEARLPKCLTASIKVKTTLERGSWLEL